MRLRPRLPSHHEIRHRVPRWARLPLGLALMTGGVFGFLPILGFWMLPLGIVVLLVDVPWVQRRWERFRAWVHGKLHHDDARTGAAASARPDEVLHDAAPREAADVKEADAARRH